MSLIYNLMLHVVSHSRSAPAQFSAHFSFVMPFDEEDVKRLVSKSLEENNAALMACMKKTLEESMSNLKRSSSESQIREIKKLKYDDPHHFKKKSNEDQFKFNLKVQDALEEANSSLENKKLDKVKSALEQGEKLLKERQKHILLADKSTYGWATVKEYKQNELADNSEDEKKMYKAEVRPKAQIKDRKPKFGKSAPKGEGKRPRFSSPLHGLTQAGNPTPTLESQYRARQTKPGTCFHCGKPGHWRAQCPAATGNSK